MTKSINTKHANLIGRVLSETYSQSSDSNNTAISLSSGAVYTGSSELVNQPDVMVTCKSSTNGTLYFDFSDTGDFSGEESTFPPDGFSVSPNVYEFHTAVKGPRYFRTRYSNDGGDQTSFRLNTYYGTFRQGNSPVNFDIAEDADSIVVKSVISGIGDTTATVTDHKSLQVTPPPEGKTSFGESLTASLTPIIEMLFNYFINPITISKQPNQSGTVTHSNQMAVCSTGAAANSSARIQSNDVVRYHPGQGVRARFTGLFTTGVANSTQIIGIGDASNGFFFGYNGATFGVLHRAGGSPEIRTLTVTTGSSTAENITITLDGDAKSDVAVTNTGDTTLTANEIAAADYSDVGRGWTAKAVGSKVIFTSWDASSRTGTYSLSGASTAVGTFAQTIAGVAPTDSWTAQTSWNGADKFDGTGITGVTLDPTKGNVFQISFQYLGFGKISFYCEDPDDGEFHLVHSIEYANANTTPSIAQPSLPLSMIAENTSNTTNIVVKTASMGAYIEGDEDSIGLRLGAKATKTLSATAAETPLLALRCKEVFQSLQNRGKIKIQIISTGVEHSKPVNINFYANPTLTGASFSDVNTAVSMVETDTSATAFSSGTFLFSINLGKTGNDVIDLKEEKYAGVLSPGNIFLATIAPTSTNGAEGTVTFNWVELL